jgi:hypothetical protein
MAVDRKAACLAEAVAFRVKAEADPANRDYWVDGNNQMAREGCQRSRTVGHWL